MTRRSLSIVILGAAGALAWFAGSAASQDAPGPRWNAEPFRSGQLTGWKLRIPGGRPLATPAYADGRIFVGGGFGSHEFYAVDAQTGRRVWTYRTSDDGPTAAAVEDGMVAFNTESCELEVLTTDGRPVWKKWLGDPLMSMPAIAAGRIYMAYPDSRRDSRYRLAAFELRTGLQLWTYPLPAELITAPVIERDRVYFATVDGTVASLDRETGREIWSDRKNATSAPAVWNDECFFSRRDEMRTRRQGRDEVQQTEVLAARPLAPAAPVREYAATRQDADYLDYSKRVSTGAERKSQSLDAAVGFAGPNKGSAPIALARTNLGQASVHGIWAYQGSKPFFDRGRLYSSMGDTVRAVDPASGRVLWSRELHQRGRRGFEDGVLTPPSIANGKIFVANSAGDVFALSSDNGDILWTASLGEAVAFQPAVANGRVYIGTNQGSLYCMATGDPRDDGWYMWGGTAAHNGRGAANRRATARR